MRIDVLKTSPDRAGRYFLQLSNGSVMRLYRQTIEDFGLYSGKELSDAELNDLKNAAGQMSAKMRAVRIISAASVSKKDLQNRLVQKGEDPVQAKQAVHWLEEMNVLDDRKTAEQVVHSCISKGYGISRARQALYEKRIPKEYWDEALVDYPDQKEEIYTFLQNRLRDGYSDRDVKKAIDALIRRGHSYGRIREVLNTLSLDTEDYPEDI